MIEQRITGRKYRVLSDAVNRIWDRLSFWTSSVDVEMGDGNTLESNLGAIKGITSSSSVEQAGYAVDATAFKSLNDTIKGKEYVLPAYTTTYTITDNAINNNSIIIVYPSVFKAGPIDMTQSGHTVTITFASRTTAMPFKLVII